MNKPSWDNAPKWANYLTINEKGRQEWHELEPIALNTGHWFSYGRVQAVDNVDWREKVEKRPQ